MCGIGGCVTANGVEPDAGRLVAMRDALCHRGPDDWGIEVTRNVGLVHTRLSIVDLSERGHQPMRHPGGNLWLAYNGEIYNHQSLRAELALEGAQFVGDCDTETLLWALDRWGETMVSRLSGQFAFAVLDVRQGRVLLCRDRFGVKPLYVARFADAVWWASEPAALIAAGVPSEPLDTAWSSLCTGSYLGGKETLLREVTRLEPGSWMSISLKDGATESWRWHVPASEVDPATAAGLERKSRSELVSDLETTLRTAVHGTLLSDATVGTLCSGGLDSSLVTALAAERMPDIVAFSASYAGDGRLQEGPAAQRVADALGIELELIEVTPSSWRRAFVPATVHHGVPIANASAVTVAQLAERARELGVKVLLTGEGADELFGGYEQLHATELSAFLPWYHRFVRYAEPALLGSPKEVLHPLSLLRRAADLVRQTLGPPPTSTWLPVFRPEASPGAPSELSMAYAHHGGERGELETALLSHLDYSLCWLLNRMDKNVMQASVEARVPFLEPAVVKLVLNLPLEARVGPWSKGILRDVARRVLPWSAAHRPKIYGMAFDSRVWIEDAANPRFLTDGLLRDTLRIPKNEFQATVVAGDRIAKVRLWSAEVWCRSALAKQSIKEIEHDLWLDEPGCR